MTDSPVLKNRKVKLKHKKKNLLTKLKRKNLLPSIIFLFFSFLLCTIGMFLIITIFTFYLIEAKLGNEFQILQSIAENTDQESYTKEDISSAIHLDVLQNTSFYTLAILSEENEPLYQYGNDKEYVPGSYFYENILTNPYPSSAFSMEINLDEIDMEKTDWNDIYQMNFYSAGPDGFNKLKLLIHVVNSCKDLSNKFSENIQNGHKTIFYSEDMWVVVPMKNTANKLICKTNITIKFDDIVAALLCGMFTLGLLCLLFFVQFVGIFKAYIQQKQTIHLLFTDAVTGGKNYLYFKKYAPLYLSLHQRGKRTYALVDFTLMKYRNICTLYGVHKGEELLSDIDSYLQKKLKRGEMIVHVSKSSFALLLYSTKGDQAPADITNRIQTLTTQLREDLGKYYTQQENSELQHVCNTILFHSGVYFATHENETTHNMIIHKNIDIDQLFNNASIARGSITEDGDITIAAFNQAMYDAQVWEHKVKDLMDDAIKNEEFVVYIQPKYNPSTNTLNGAEALIRWNSPTEGFIPPGRFIPIIESSGNIKAIDDYMLSHVAALQAKWLAEGKKIVPVSVNVSRAHFANPYLAEHICKLIDQYNVPHNYIEIELTESAFFDDKNLLLSTVKKLQNYGFEVSMDDFGSGYSSLNSLKDLPLNVLKLDADFFRGKDTENRGEIVISEAIALAKKLNMKIVAEGIENENHVKFLAEQNCDMIQGYFYAKPMPPEEYEKRMDQPIYDPASQESVG